jgi:hypothetical protein
VLILSICLISLILDTTLLFTNELFLSTAFGLVSGFSSNLFFIA